MTRAQNVPHALAIPYPGQGHATPMMQLCKKLASQDFIITFVTGDIHYERILESHKLSGDLELDIRLESAPMPGIQVGKSRRSVDLAVWTEAAMNMSSYVSQLLERLSKDGPPITCIISDVLISSWTQDLADKHQIPRIAFFTCNQTFYTFFFYFSLLRARGQIAFSDIGKNSDHSAESNGSSIYFNSKDVDPIVTALPGLSSLRFQDLPTFIHSGDATQYMYDHIADQLKEIHRAERILVNTLYELESSAIDALSSEVPTYAIGPLLPAESKNSGTSLLPEQDNCLQWLDGQPSGSVIYVSFGSVAKLSRKQFQEVALGLEASGQRFLWVLRPALLLDDDAQDPGKHLPPGFLAGTKGRGYMVSWAPQLQVLSHAAVGAFLTHCGWNSTMESIANGVPMIGWPYFADQMLNARLVVEEWGVGMEIRGAPISGEEKVVGKEEVERVVKTMMQGEQGKAMRNKAAVFKLLVNKSIVQGGHSFNNLQAFVQRMRALAL